LQCRNNLKQIIIALYDYHDAYGSFPPAYIADKNGRPMHSWRVLILPFLEQKPLYDLYDLNEPWDGPNNRKLADVCVSIFNCPADNEEPSTMTSYLAVVGPNTAWPGSQPTCIMDFTDGTSNTLLLVEVANSGIHWMEPRDLHVLQMAPTVNPAAGQGVSSLHPGGANAAFADGSVRFLPDNTSPEQLRAMLTRSGGESVELEDLGQ
jgi:prepilin-type processing-associated H-X9-DG protein